MLEETSVTSLSAGEEVASWTAGDSNCGGQGAQNAAQRLQRKESPTASKQGLVRCHVAGKY